MSENRWGEKCDGRERSVSKNPAGALVVPGRPVATNCGISSHFK